jgi:hypothetical protein
MGSTSVLTTHVPSTPREKPAPGADGVGRTWNMTLVARMFRLLAYAGGDLSTASSLPLILETRLCARSLSLEADKTARIAAQ